MADLSDVVGAIGGIGGLLGGLFGDDKTRKIEVTNPEFREWYEAENQRRQELNRASSILAGLMFTQWVLYLTQYLKNLGDRDDMIDKSIGFMDYIQSKKHGEDLEMSKLKVEVRNLALPDVNLCSDSTINDDYTNNDGLAIDQLSKDLSDKTCGGVPQGWALYEGQLLASRASANVGGLISNASVREREWFQKQKSDLMISAQRNAKAPYNSSEILSMYAQSMSIYSGLADMFGQGVNSAGAGLGVYLGRLANPNPLSNMHMERTKVINPDGGPING